MVSTAPPINEPKLTLLENELHELLGKNHFYRLGEIFSLIRDKKLYKQTHSLFGSYCREKWDKTVSYVNYLIRAYQITNELKSDFPNHLPSSEYCLRLISRYDIDQIKHIWSKVIDLVDNSKEVTTNVVKNVINELFPKPKPVRKKPEYKPVENPLPLVHYLRNETVPVPLTLNPSSIKKPLIDLTPSGSVINDSTIIDLTNPLVIVKDDKPIKTIETLAVKINEIPVEIKEEKLSLTTREIDNLEPEILELEQELKQVLKQLSSQSKKKQLLAKIKAEIKAFFEDSKSINTINLPEDLPLPYPIEIKDLLPDDLNIYFLTGNSPNLSKESCYQITLKLGLEFKAITTFLKSINQSYNDTIYTFLNTYHQRTSVYYQLNEDQRNEILSQIFHTQEISPSLSQSVLIKKLQTVCKNNYKLPLEVTIDFINNFQGTNNELVEELKNNKYPNHLGENNANREWTLNRLYEFKRVHKLSKKETKQSNNQTNQNDILIATNKPTFSQENEAKTKVKEEQSNYQLEKYTKSLTNSQTQSFFDMVNFVKSRDKYYKLTGYAGTGKSYLIVEFIKYLQSEKKSLIVASPTNKAAKNISKLAIKAAISVESTTLAKLLSLQPDINEIKGNEVFISIEPDKKLDSDLIFVDEYSMVSQDNLDLLSEKISGTKTKVIFVGDSAQLPPINEKEPPVDHWSKIKKFSHLLEIVRYDGDIAKIAEEIRTNSEYNNKIYPFNTTEDESIICLPRNDWENEIKKFMASQDFKNDPNFARVLVWRNNTADRINNIIRLHLFGKDCKPFEVGDLLIAKTPVFRSGMNPKTRKLEWSIVMNNSEECLVKKEAISKDLTISLFQRDYTFKYWEVPVITEANVHLDLQILTHESKVEIEKIKKEVKDYIYIQPGNKKSFWEKYQVLEKTFDNTPFAYAITTHKAQGSSINHVFIDVADLKACGDLQKIQYTAFTRATEKVWIPV